MIRYSRNSRWTLFYWWGGILRDLIKPAGFYLLFLVHRYLFAHFFNFKLGAARASVSALGGFVMFLLVFRMNQCMARHVHGNTLSSQLFSDLEFVTQSFCTCLAGSDPIPLDFETTKPEVEECKLKDFAEIAIVAKINVVRLTLALALSFVAHCWLLDAAAGSQGAMDEDVLLQVVFLCIRLEGLLYPEEMRLVDEALSITKEVDTPAGPQSSGLRRPSAGTGGIAEQLRRLLEEGVPQETRSLSSCVRATRWLQAMVGAIDDDEQPVFRAEVNRHRFKDRGMPLFGRQAGVGERSVVPLPKVLAQLLLDLTMMPVAKAWGYPERFMNFFVSKISNAVSHMEELSRLVSQPLPLAYLQHCRLLLFIYAILCPMSVDPLEGLFENIIMPLLTFATLYGFELLAADLENPLGFDEMDLNLLGMVHSLEVISHQCFDFSEEGRIESRKALRRPLLDFGLTSGVEGLRRLRPISGPRRQQFTDFFAWQPIPTSVLSPLIQCHGHVDSVHLAWANGRGLRKLLRGSLQRGSRRSHDGGMYAQLSNRDAESPLEGVDSEDGDMLGEFNDDPMLWCHYLCLRRPALGDDGAPSSQTQRQCWSTQLQPMLRSTAAGALFPRRNGDTDVPDSERTELPTTPRVRRQVPARDPHFDLDHTSSGLVRLAPPQAPVDSGQSTIASSEVQQLPQMPKQELVHTAPPQAPQVQLTTAGGQMALSAGEDRSQWQHSRQELVLMAPPPPPQVNMSPLVGSSPAASSNQTSVQPASLAPFVSPTPSQDIQLNSAPAPVVSANDELGDVGDAISPMALLAATSVGGGVAPALLGFENCGQGFASTPGAREGDKREAAQQESGAVSGIVLDAALAAATVPTATQCGKWWEVPGGQDSQALAATVGTSVCEVAGAAEKELTGRVGSASGRDSAAGAAAPAAEAAAEASGHDEVQRPRYYQIGTGGSDIEQHSAQSGGGFDTEPRSVQSSGDVSGDDEDVVE
mmetsp:Transcript_170281/g.546157  ORF Transcript_170281/g.546157 Transcript_170281/m.546157 type:complete len:981 (+) Transcript_170281:125-3067(+)